MSAMPGRSDLSVDQYRLTGGAADPERETRLWSLWMQRALDAESALLAAEARVLEVEQERDDHRRAAIDNLAWGKMAEADMATLRAERDALTAALADADVLVQHYEGYALTAAVRANISDLRVGVAPEIIAAGERYAARILARREKGGA